MANPDPSCPGLWGELIPSCCVSQTLSSVLRPTGFSPHRWGSDVCLEPSRTDSLPAEGPLGGPRGQGGGVKSPDRVCNQPEVLCPPDVETLTGCFPVNVQAPRESCLPGWFQERPCVHTGPLLLRWPNASRVLPSRPGHAIGPVPKGRCGKCRCRAAHEPEASGVQPGQVADAALCVSFQRAPVHEDEPRCFCDTGCRSFRGPFTANEPSPPEACLGP